MNLISNTDEESKLPWYQQKTTYKYIFLCQVCIFLVTTLIVTFNGGIWEFLGTTGAYIYFAVIFAVFASLIVSRWCEIKFCCSKNYEDEKKNETIEEICIVKTEGLIVTQQDQLKKLAHDLC